MDESPCSDTMPDVGEAAGIFERAASRARQSGLAYAGAVTPTEAHRLVQAEAADIVDVRTLPEWEFVGHIEGSRRVEWRAWGASTPHVDFVANVAAHYGPDDAILLLCRSAVRSHHAAEALTRAGFRRAYNILQGFEGDRDALGRRNTVGGWRFAGLPWTQS
jgi:rhodanese-related sulfurtransferase